MSTQRRAIQRLSFALRLFLYVALILAVGWIGFGYSSGYVAIPGNAALAFEAFPASRTAPNVIIVNRDVVCKRKITRAENGEVTGEVGGDCLAMPFVEFKLEDAPGSARQGTRNLVITDDEIDLRIRYKSEGESAGAKTKGHIRIEWNGTVFEREFEGETVPERILNEVPEEIRARVKTMIEQAPKIPDPPAIPTMPNAPSVPETPNAPEAPERPGAGRSSAPPLPPIPAIPPIPPAPEEFGFVNITGPAIIHQQVEGHQAFRLTLVGATIALVVLAIVQLERLLAHFQKGELFSARNTGLLRNLGLLLLAITVVQAAATLLPALLAKALHPTLIGALGPHFVLLFAGCAVLLLSQVIGEAARLEDEALHTV